jgi:hypothetical protein
LFACSGNNRIKDFAFTKEIVFEEIGQVWSIDTTNNYLVVRETNFHETDIVLIDKKANRILSDGVRQNIKNL